MRVWLRETNQAYHDKISNINVVSTDHLLQYGYMYKYNPATQATVGVATQFDLVCKTQGLWDRSVDVLGAEKTNMGVSH